MKDEIVHHKGGGVTFAGENAVRVVAATALASSLALYAQTGILPTRGVTLTRMLAAARNYLPDTKFPRTRFGAQMAAEALADWSLKMRATIPERRDA